MTLRSRRTFASRAGVERVIWGPAGCWRVLLLIAAWNLIAIEAGLARDADQPKNTPDPGIRVQPGEIVQLEIEIAPDELAKLEKENRTYVRGIVRHEGQVYTDAGIRLKGHGSFRPLSDKPNFSIKFDEFKAQQQLSGLNKILLNNSIQDGSYVAGILCTELFAAASVPTARMTHARIKLNGRDLGWYVLAEGMTKAFLRRCFGNDTGNLYEPAVQDIDQRLDQDNGENHGQTDLAALVEAARETDAEKRIEQIGRHLDIDRFLGFIAMEMIMWHGDGFTLHRNNCRIYHDPETDKMIFIPHGLDQMFTQPQGSIMPPMNELIVGALLQTPDGQRRYRERAAALVGRLFRLEVLTNRVNELLAPILAQMSAHDVVAASAVAENAASLQARIVARAKHLAKELAAPEPLFINFGEACITHVAGWQASDVSGSVKLELSDHQGIPALSINAGDVTTASWRTRVVLQPGQYEFVARARGQGIVPIRDGLGIGAGVRISNPHQRRQNQLERDSEWTTLRYNFEVHPPSAQVELVCELRAYSGQVWFDLGSLQLIHVSRLARDESSSKRAGQQ